MAENNALRQLVFGLVATGELNAETAMALLKRAREMGGAVAMPATQRPSEPTPRIDAGPQSGGARDPVRDIAVIGMAGRFGNKPDLDAFWRMIEAGEDCLVEMPARRWPDAGGARRRGGFLPDEDQFDPLFFRISPTEAAMMDPQQRLFLEAAYHALEDAGYPERALSGVRCGVFAGAGSGDYAQRLRDAGQQTSALGLMGNVTSILAARISYFLNLKGPSVALDTACSSSLVAVHLACESLVSGTCDMALAGGVAVISTPQFIGAMTDGGMLSPNDRCAAFDAAADGFVCGEGVGVVVLKRLADAMRDGDPIHGIIRGSGINQDGRTNGITAPSAPSQAALEEEVYRRASVDPATISYVETHGTGTPLGDPIELEALTSSFRKFTDRTGYCAIGSAKANFGHALTAAGIAGLIKVLLMMRHRRIPPMAGFQQPNPRIDFARSPFMVPTSAMDWNPAGPRRAAVSSFGFSGTNAHVVIEEAPAPPARDASGGPFLFLIAARSGTALRARAEDLLRAFDRDRPALCDVAHTLAVGREHPGHRLAVVAQDAAALAAGLHAWLAGQRHPAVFAGEARPEGPGPALIAFARTISRETLDQDRLSILGDLYVQGADLDWAALPGASSGRRISLPGYPFERGSYAPAAVVSDGEVAAPAPTGTRDARSDVVAALGAVRAPDLSGQAQAFRAVEAWGRRALAGVYARMGLFDRHVYTVTGLRRSLGIVDAKRRLHDALVDMLVRDGVLAREGDLLRVRDTALASDLVGERTKLAASEPELAPFLTLLDRCVTSLPDLLTGKVTATEVMFPDGRTDLVEPIYQGSRLAEHLNATLAESVAALVAGLGRPARVIEIGAGTGGATVAILRALDQRSGSASYHYTDVSRGFTHLGRQRFGATHPDMTFEVLDLERSPAEQGFTAADFDIVIASNVLHACRQIDAALNHAAWLLRPGGWLLLNEVTALQDYATLTFGLTDGWWAFEDEAARIPNAPLLTVSGWQSALERAGFPRMDAFGLPGEARDSMSQAVIVAERSGSAVAITAQPAALVAAPPVAAPVLPAGDGLSAIIAREVAALLNMPVERMDRRGRFMDYGIDSILGGQVIARLNQVLGLDLRPIVLFDHPSIDDLARHIGRDHAPRLPAANVVAQPQPAPTVATPEQPDLRIAVIGMAARFADCPDLTSFHRMLADGRSGITDVPADRWSAESETLPDGVGSEARFLRRGGFLLDAADFDPLFFRISGKEAELTDPQHRVFLTEAWRALEDAGYAERELDGRRCGVFVGAYGGDYTHRMTDLGIVPEAFAFMGNAAAILSARIAYVLNLKGPCLAVDTACSSSLSAIHLACRSLLDGECDMALAGGVFLTTTMGFNVAAAKAGMLSPEGACKTFDADADGFVPGEGAGVIVLKPYAKAVADGDHIEAVILASAMNQDGKTNGITAPSADSQAALEVEVYEKAGIDPSRIGYIEAHGTGTPLGDPIEIEGLTRAFRNWTDRTGFCTIGSVKTNIGHAAHAAGIAGFIKAALSVRHRTLFPSLHFRAENPALRLSTTPFRVNTQLRPWETDGAPRIAAVSSFGFSGTNVHILLSEPAPVPEASVDHPCIIALSARSRSGLRRKIGDLRAWLGDHSARLVDIARTLNGGRCHFEYRWVCVADSVEALRGALADDSAEGVVIDTSRGRAGDLAAMADAYLRTGELPAAAIPAGGRRISLPTYPFEMRRYWLDRAGDAPTKPVVARATYLVPDWQPAALATGTPRGPIWLLSEGDATATSLASFWRSQGQPVVVMDPERMADSRARDGVPAGVVNLLSLQEAGEPGVALGRGARIAFQAVRTLFGDAVPVLHLHRGRPDQACVQALRRSARFDGAQVDFRTLWIDGALPPVERLATWIASELVAPHGVDTEVAIRNGERLVRRMIAREPAAAPRPLRQGGHYLITGGGGVLAGLFARRIAAETRGRVTLIGRSPASDAVQATIAACGSARYLQADVTDEPGLAAAVASARAAHGPIQGVIHAAGVPAVTSLRESDWTTFSACLAPKVAGLVTLDHVLRDEPLDFFVAFSSLAGELGDFGQGAYACGNSFCDRFAAWRNDAVAQGRRKGHSVALGWPLWREGRGVMSTEGERIYLATAGMPYLEAEQGWQAFQDALVMGVAQIAVVPGDPAKARALFDPNPGATAPTVGKPKPAEAPVARPTVTAPDAALPAKVRQALTTLVAQQMKIDEDLLSPTAGLAEFGFDSIALKEFSVLLGEAYGITLSPAVFFARGTIEALADYLIEAHPAEVAARHADRPVQADVPAPAPVVVEPVRPAPVDGPIAVIGISGRFPHSPDLDAFWHNLEAGVDLVGPLPDQRELASQGPYDRSSLRGGFLDRIDTFDAPFFRMSPREACFLDPQHRVAIEAVWHCVEDAGLRMGALAGRSVGVFFGPQVNEYGAIIPDRDAARAQIALGNIATMLPNRISYLFDLRGPSEAIDTACSSSLVAVHRAVRALQSGECEMALAGGVSLVLTAESIVSTMELGVVSPDGRCHSFDARANGYVKGEGVGVVLLKPLAQAEADGDVIHAVILGSAENHGGHAHSLTAPNGTAQAALIATALRRAGVSSDTIGYVEAHGTGTELGDPVEVIALKEAFTATAEPDSVAERACLLGTVKTNIGHLEPASGVAGLLKTVLALKHQVLPASLHFEQLNPLIDFTNTPFAVIAETRAWAPLRTRDGRALPRRAGVSSFGLGGSNVHLVLQEYAAPAATGPQPDAVLLVVSARDRDRLAASLRRLADFVRANPDVPVADVAHTLVVGREPMAHRAAILWRSGDRLEERFLTAAATVESGATVQAIWIGSVARPGIGRTEAAPADMLDLLQRGRWDQVATQWVNGSALPAGCTSGRRIALPGYPFAPLSFWFDQGQGGAMRAQAAPPSVATPQEVTPPPEPVRQAAMPVIEPPAAEPTRPVAQRSAPATPSRSLEEVRAVVRQHLAAALYLDEDQLDDHTGFADLGLDSILAVELTKSLNDELGTDLQATRLYDHANAAELAVFLHTSLMDRPVGGADDPAAAPAIAFVLEQLAAVGAVGLSATSRLDSIALEPAQAKAILAVIADRFGCTLAEADVARCPDIAALGGLITARSAAARDPGVGHAAEPSTPLPVVPPFRSVAEPPSHGVTPVPVAAPIPASTVPAPDATTTRAPHARLDSPVEFRAPAMGAATAVIERPPAVAEQVDRARDTAPTTTTTEVAIIGYACRLPGASDPDAFWDLLCRGGTAVTPFPAEAWRREGFERDLRSIGASVTPWGGYIDQVDRFDAGFFAIKPDQARLMDPQQRLFLQAAWHALEMAGQTRARLDGAACGVFVGGGPSDYGRVLEADGEAARGETLFGNISSILAARIAYFLNLHGPCVALDTACSSGLVALHAGWRAIRDGECDMALVGGVNMLLTPQMHVLTGAAGMLSPSGSCRSFDDAADGFVPAEGIVALVLKRLDRALADGDPVQGVIQGVAINQNGTTAGITAPSAKAQTRLLHAVYDRFAIPAAEVGLVEAHGTGTRIGDALEFDALREAFQKAGVPAGRCVLGSAKPVIGHAFAASGLASIVKLLMALRHRQIPPTRGIEQPNSHMRLAGSPFRINPTQEPWPAPPNGRRMAAATSYGLSGTNAHVVLAEAPDQTPPAEPRRDAYLIAVSATDQAALRRRIGGLAAMLEREDPDLSSLAYTLGARRTHFRARAAFVARDLMDLRAQLAAWPGSVDQPEPADLIALAQSYRAGGVVDWDALYPFGRVCRLPDYPFASDRHWPGATREAAAPAAPSESVSETPSGTTIDRLLPIVARCLGVDPGDVTPDTPFEVLGITSVAAVALMHEAEQAFGVELPVIALWDHPDPARLAAYIDTRPAARRVPSLLGRAGRTSAGEHDAAVGIRVGGDGPISFWVHGGPGDVNWVAELARLLPPDHQVYGLEAVGLDGVETPLPSVEAMAAHYIVAIRRIQPVGPYRIGGYSAGGVIAFEMVRQLTRDGHAIADLILLDCNAPGFAGLADMQADFGPGYVYLVVGGWLATQWGGREPLPLSALDGLDKPAMLDRVLDHLFSGAPPPLSRSDARTVLETLDRVGWTVGQALRDYRPTGLDAPIPVTLIACARGMAGGDNPLGLPDGPAARDYRNGWAALLAQPPQEVVIDCDHFSLFRAAAADSLRSALAPAPADPVRDLVLGLVRETLPDVPAELVVPERSMTELGATSIDRVDVATLAMESLEIRVPHEALAGVNSIGELIDLLRRHVGHG